MCVSDPSLAKAILACNGYEKIQPLCAFTSLVWTNDQLNSFIRLKLPHLQTEDIENVHQLAHNCNNSPGIVVMASSFLMKDSDSISKQQYDILNRYSNSCKSSWEKFESDE